MMEQPVSIAQGDLQNMAEELERNLTDFCESIPDSDAKYFKSRFLDCITPLTGNIYSLGKQNNRIDKMRYYVLAEISLNQCKDYLSLVGQLHYAETKDLIDDVQQFRRFLNSSTKFIEYET